MAILAILLLSAFGAMAGSREAEPVDFEASHPLSPELETAEMETTDTATGEDGETLPLEAGAAVTDQTRLGDVLPLPETIVTPEPRPGRLVIDLAYGDFRIRRGAPGESLKVEAKYDASRFKLEEELVEDGESWTYRVTFEAKGGMFGMMFGGGVDKGDNRVTITIPPDHPVDLVGKMGLGELQADLGGLWLRQLDLDLGVGDQTLSFAEPTREPMESFKIVSSVGEVKVEELGNASPHHVTFEHSVGESRLDLSGPWRNDAEVRASFSIGEMRLRLPDDVKVALTGKKISIGEINASTFDDRELGPEAHTLTLDIQGSIGEISID